CHQHGDPGPASGPAADERQIARRQRAGDRAASAGLSGGHRRLLLDAGTRPAGGAPGGAGSARTAARAAPRGAGPGGARRRTGVA
ncbi:hypothetical protein DF186_20105, partial [Enterococcus hirae]